LTFADRRRMLRELVLRSRMHGETLRRSAAGGSAGGPERDVPSFADSPPDVHEFEAGIQCVRKFEGGIQCVSSWC
jgi:hypothetical protein